MIPQMGPMIWFIFPFIMVSLVLFGVIILNGGFGVNEGMERESVMEMKCLSW